MRNNEHLLQLAMEYSRVSGEGQMKVCSKICEWAKTLDIGEIEELLKRMIKTYKTVWNLHNEERCYIIKENGEIIETRYEDNEYFRNVRVYGNLAVTYKQAQIILLSRRAKSRLENNNRW